MIQREIATSIRNQLRAPSAREVILVAGARQVGKTTVVQEVLSEFSHSLELNLEKDSEARAAIDATVSFQDFENLLRDKYNFNSSHPLNVLFIDEAQESDTIGSYIRHMKEDWNGAKAILSGSSMTRIFRDDQRVPVGRYLPLLVSPLSFKEFIIASGREFLLECISEFEETLSTKQITPSFHREFLDLLDQYLTIGGLPEVVKAHFSKRNPFELRTALLLSQEDDFVRKSSISERMYFRLGLRGVANYLGFPAKNTHVHEKQHIAEKILSVESAWHLIHQIEQHGMNSTSRILPKRYLYDIGMAQEIREMPFPNLSLTATTNPALRTQLGGLFENTLLLQLISFQHSVTNISGWNKSPKERVEVDFVWRLDSRVVPIECKASVKVTKRSFSSLRQYLDISQSRVGVLVSAAPFEIVREGEKALVNVPLYLASGRGIKRVVEES